MQIGLTYDLRSEYLAAGYGEEETAEFDRDETIDALDASLRALGHRTDRIGHARQLIQRLARGDRWELVFNICEGLSGSGREAQVPAILDIYQIPYTFADPAVMAVCLHKGWTKTVVQAAGVPTPRFVVAEREADLARVDFACPLFAKPIAEGTGKGVTPQSRITRPEDLAPVCRQLWDKFHEPVLIEQFLPGREFTVGLLGTGAEARALGTLEVLLLATAEPGVYSYMNKELSEQRVELPLVSAATDATVAEAERIALAAWRALGGRDAGRIDMRCDAAGNPQFLEANPLAGLHPTHSDLPILWTTLGRSYIELLDAIVQSAAARSRSLPSGTAW